MPTGAGGATVLQRLEIRIGLNLKKPL